MAVTYLNTLVSIEGFRRSWENGVRDDGEGINFWRNPAQVGDYIIFGGRANASSLTGEATLQGAFDGITFDVTQSVVIAGYTYIWEYYSTGEGVPAWKALAVTDNTNGLQTLGVNSVDFDPPDDWYWRKETTPSLTPIRIRITAATGTTSVGSQTNGVPIKIGENIIRVTGTETIRDIWDADQSAGWNRIIRSEGFVQPTVDIDGDYPDFGIYNLKAYLAVGDGSTATTLTKKHGSIWSPRIFNVRNNATLELGEQNAEGFSELSLAIAAFYDLTSLRGWTGVDPGGLFRMWGGTLAVGSWIQSQGAFECYETTFIGRYGGYQFYTDDTVLRRVTVINPVDGFRAYGEVDLTDVTLISAAQGLYFGEQGAADVTYSRLKITKADQYQLYPVGYTPGFNTLSFDDCDIENELSMWKIGSQDLTIDFRNTWSAHIRNAAGEDLEGVRVVCKDKDGATVFDVTTDANGETGVQAIVRNRVYYAVGQSTLPANGTVTDFNPFTFTLTKGALSTVYIDAALEGGTTCPIIWDIVMGGGT